MNRLHTLRPLAALLTFGLLSTARAEPSAVAIADGAVQSAGEAMVMRFVVQRSGDLSYDASVHYRTVDGTALAGVNYEATSGTLLIESGLASALIDVPLIDTGTADSDLSFQLQLDGASGFSTAAQFATPLELATTLPPAALAAGDFNADGFADLVYTIPEDDHVGVRLNKTAPAGNLKFRAESLLDADGSSSDVAVGDLNRDGKPDIVLIAPEQDRVAILYNGTAPLATNPKFSAPESYAVGAAPSSLILADVDVDGTPNVITASYEAANVSYLIYRTTSPQYTAVHISLSSGVADIDAGDVNSDGFQDLVVALPDEDKIAILINEKPFWYEGSWTKHRVKGTNHPLAVRLLDVDRDGRQDLVVGNGAAGKLAVIINRTVIGSTSVAFDKPIVMATGLDIAALTPGDFNGDGAAELIAADDGDGSPGLWTTRNVTAAGQPARIDVANRVGVQPVRSLLATDLNRDGLSDIAYVEQDRNVVAATVNVTPATAAVVTLASGVSTKTKGAPEAKAEADINHDGKLDLFVAHDTPSPGAVSVFLNATDHASGEWGYASADITEEFDYPEDVHVADFNSDGALDLVANSQQQLHLRINKTETGSDRLTFLHATTPVVGDPLRIAVSDLNLDRRPDLIVPSQSAGSLTVHFNSTAQDSDEAEFYEAGTVALGSYLAGAASSDVNNDGRPDVVVTGTWTDEQQATQTGAMMLINSTAPDATTVSFDAPLRLITQLSVAGMPRLADINRDGRLDLVVDGDQSVAFFLNISDGDSTTPQFAPVQFYSSGCASPFSSAIGDVNGDAAPDLVLASSSGCRELLINTTSRGATAPSYQAIPIDAKEGESPVLTDANADGRQDVIISVPTQDKFWIKPNQQLYVAIDAALASGVIPAP